MKAIIVQEDKSLHWENVSDPEPGPNEVLIRTQAASVNRADLAQRAGAYRPPSGTTDILGLDCVGVIEQTGQGAQKWSKGQQVCALLTGGAYAEQVITHENNCLPLPKGLTLEQATAVVEVYATAYLNLIMLANLKPGQQALVHAGASGVGLAAIDICTILSIDCFVTVGSKEKLAFCLKQGAKGGCIRNEIPFSTLAKEWTGGEGFNAILDPVGSGYLGENIKSLAMDGSLICIGIMSGRLAELDMGRLLVKRLRIMGSTLRSRSIEEKTLLLANLQRDIWPHFENGAIVPTVDSVFSIQDAEKAHEHMEQNLNTGKIILLF